MPFLTDFNSNSTVFVQGNLKHDKTWTSGADLFIYLYIVNIKRMMLLDLKPHEWEEWRLIF